MALSEPRVDPYVGPLPFGRDDAWRFFGRLTTVEELFSLLVGSRVVVLYAQSGAGKTSLVNAGLLPLVEQEGFDVLPPARVQGLAPPGSSLQDLGNPYTFFTLSSWPATAGEASRPTTVAEHLRARPRPLDRFGDPASRLIIVDQFEELFTAFPDAWHQRPEFIADLADALEDDPRLRLLLCLREDYLADALSLAPSFPDGIRSRFRLSQLRHDDASQAIEGPAAALGVRFATGVVASLVNDLLTVRVETRPGVASEVRGEFVEPVQLQVVCSSLWRAMPQGATEITMDELTQLGDVTTTLAAFYDDAIAATSAHSRVHTADLRRWFEEVLITPSGTRGMAYRGPEATQRMPNSAVDALEDLHMIRAEARAGARWYELTHDRFIRPIQASNARARDSEQTSLWGIVPLLVGIGLAIFLGIRSPYTGPVSALVYVACGVLGGVGLGQLLAAASERRLHRKTSEVRPSKWRLAIGIVLLVTAAASLLIAIGTALDRPENYDTSGTFPEYVHRLTGAQVQSSPECKGSILTVFVRGSEPELRGVDLRDVQKVPNLAELAQSWCVDGARQGFVTTIVFLGLAALLVIFVVVTWRGRRRHRVPSLASTPLALRP